MEGPDDVGGSGLAGDGQESRVEKMLKLRLQGHSLASIGRQYGLSRERVRQILQEHFPDQLDAGNEAASDRARRQTQDRRGDLLERAAAWAKGREHFTAQQLQEAIPATRVDRLWLRRQFHDRLIYPTLDPTYTDEQILTALRKASARHQGLLSKRRYDEVRQDDWPTSVTVTNRLGWNNALAQAGLQITPALRTYTRTSHEQIFVWVQKYLQENPGGSMSGYEAWARSRPQAPSGSTVRKRYRRWHELVDQVEKQQP